MMGTRHGDFNGLLLLRLFNYKLRFLVTVMRNGALLQYNNLGFRCFS